MIAVSPKHRIFLAIEPINFKNGLDGIAAICRRHYHQDPMSGHYSIFRNKRKTDIKIFYFDSQGLCLFQKRMSSGRFNAWPKHPSSLVLLTSAQLHILIFNGDPSQVETAAEWRPLITDPINWN